MDLIEQQHTEITSPVEYLQDEWGTRRDEASTKAVRKENGGVVTKKEMQTVLLIVPVDMRTKSPTRTSGLTKELRQE